MGLIIKGHIYFAIQILLLLTEYKPIEFDSSMAQITKDCHFLPDQTLP